MVDLNDIALFVHVVRAGSFAAAARRLGMPSNTVSRRIQGLEQHLGVRLLQRSTRQLTLTAAGTTLFERSAGQVEALVEAATAASEGSAQATGKVRVAAAADFFRWFQVAWLSDFLAEHPRVRLEFVLSDAHADLIEEGIDVAIRANVDNDSTLVARLVGSGRATLVASPDYLAERGMPQTVAALSAHDCVVTPKASGQATWTLTGPGGVEAVEVSGRFHANAMQALLDATLAGMGIGLFPTVVTAPLLRDGLLVEVLPAYGTDTIGIYLAYPSRRQLPRAVSAFVEFMTARMRDAGLVSPP
jgi:LysR family transcriptional regulator AphB